MDVQGSVDEAMARYAAGDDAAFALLYSAVSPRLTRFFRRRLMDTAMLPEISPDTCSSQMPLPPRVALPPSRWFC